MITGHGYFKMTFNNDLYVLMIFRNLDKFPLVYRNLDNLQKRMKVAIKSNSRKLFSFKNIELQLNLVFCESPILAISVNVGVLDLEILK